MAKKWYLPDGTVVDTYQPGAVSSISDLTNPEAQTRAQSVAPPTAPTTTSSVATPIEPQFAPEVGGSFRNLMLRLFPEKIQPALAQGLKVDDLEDFLRKDLQSQLTGNPQGFLETLATKRLPQETRALLEYLGLDEPDIDQVVGIPETQSQVVRAISSIPDLDRFLLTSRVPGDTNLDKLTNLLQLNPQQFVAVMSAGGITEQKKQLLRLMGFSPTETLNILNPNPLGSATGPAVGGPSMISGGVTPQRRVPSPELSPQKEGIIPKFANIVMKGLEIINTPFRKGGEATFAIGGDPKQVENHKLTEQMVDEFVKRLESEGLDSIRDADTPRAKAIAKELQAKYREKGWLQGSEISKSAPERYAELPFWQQMILELPATVLLGAGADAATLGLAATNIPRAAKIAAQVPLIPFGLVTGPGSGLPPNVGKASKAGDLAGAAKNVPEGQAPRTSATVLETLRTILPDVKPEDAIAIIPDGTSLGSIEYRRFGAFQHLADSLPPISDWFDAGVVRIAREESGDVSIEILDKITEAQFKELSKVISTAKNVFVDVANESFEGSPNVIRERLRTFIEQPVIETQPRRGAAPPIKPPEPPKVATGAEPPEPIKGRAANIRLDKFSEDTRPIIKQWADTHRTEVEAATRGKIPDAQVRLKAEQLISEVGGDLEKLRANWKSGVTMNAEEVTALRGALSQSTQNVIDLQKMVKADSSVENLLRLQDAIQEQVAIQEAVHGVTAEAGRALRAFRQSFSTAAGDEAKMAKLLKRIGGKVHMEQVAKMLEQLDINDPIAVNKFLQSLQKPKISDYLTEIFYNSVLSGPKTHIVNNLSNTVNAIWSPIERTASALVDLPLSVVQGRPRARFLNEVPADIFGAVKGVPEGFRQFAYVIKNGISLEDVSKWEFRQKAFKGKLGTVINLPSRFLEGADQLMKAVNVRAALNAGAHRMASIEKLSGPAFEKRVAELLADPPIELLAEANKIAEYRLFRAPMGKTGQAILKARDSVDIAGFQPLRFVVPFIRTPMNLVKYGLERTPLGFANPRLWQNLASKNPEAAEQLARATIGSIGLASLTWYAKEGFITGAPPRNAAERERFYREGKQPYAIRVGEFWVSYQRLEPLNQLLGQVAILVDAINNKDRNITEKIGDAVNTFGQNFVSQTYMSSLSDLMNMFAEPERYAGNWLNRFATAMAVPMSSASRTATQMLDDVVRDPQDAWEMIQTNIPGLSKNIQPKLTALGEEIRRKSPPWFPINVTPVEETVLSQELERLKYNIGFVGDTISGVKLNKEEQLAYQKQAGGMIRQDLEKLMVVPEYWTATDEQKKKMIEKVINTARDAAKLKIRQKMYSSGAEEDRFAQLVAGLKNANAQLDKVLSSVPEFSHEPPNIYDVATELDAAYRTLLEGIPLNELDPKALQKANLPPTVFSWYEKEEAKTATANMPNKRLSILNADPEQGDTFEDYYNQWQQYQAAEDKVKWVKEHPQYDKYYLGNISRRDFQDLKTYHNLSGQEQLNFLKTHSNLNVNPKEDWLMNNPRANAQLAIWGDAKLLTKEAYDAYQVLVKEFDLVDTVLPLKPMTPQELKVFEIEKEKQFREVTAQIETARLLTDEKVREERVAELRQTKIGGMTYKDLERKVEGIKLDAPDEIINKWIERGRTVDETASSSAEAKLFLVDNPELFQWALENQLLTDDGKDWDIPVLRIDVKYRKQDAEYDNLPTEGTARADYLQKNDAYRKDRRRRDAYGLGLTEDMVEKHVEYFELPVKGYRQERYLIDNSDYAIASGKKIPAKVPNEQYDILLEKYEKEDAEYESLTDKGQQAAYLSENPTYANDRIRREAYQTYVPDEHVENYVIYKTIPKGEYEDEWFLMENQDFYQNVYLGTMGNQRKDFRKVPTRSVYEKYLVYQDLSTSQKQDYRRSNPDLDEWGQLKFGWKPVKPASTSTGTKSSTQSQYDDLLRRIRALSQ